MTELSTKTLTQLRKMCAELGVKIPVGTRRELIERLYTTEIAPLSEEERGKLTKPLKKPSGCKKSVTPAWMDGGDWVEHLERHGWAVAPLPTLDAEGTLSDFYGWLEGCKGGFDRENPTTWTKDSMPPRPRGIFRHYVGYEPFVWNARLASHKIFSEIWGTADLVSSLDGACFLAPNDKSGGKGLWVHSDQPRLERGLACVQGLVNLHECGPEDGGLVVLEGSHKVFSKYLGERPLDGWSPQWFPDLSSPLLKDLALRKICAGAGEIVLWDSRTFHCNTTPTGDQPRACIYVSMVPAAHLTEEEHKKRAKCVEDRKMTGHACRGLALSVHRRDPFMYGHPFLKPEDVRHTLRDKERALVGPIAT